MKKFITILCTIALLAGGMTTPAGAALNAVGPIDVADGFPVWYEDANLLRLEKCLIPGAQCLNPELGVANPLLPIVFPGNFPDEWFYYNATAGPVTDPGLAVGALLVLALEGSFATAPVIANGQQITFARIRFRFTPTASGNFVVTHPFGTITVAGTAGAVVTASQDLGIAAGVFTGALLDGPAGGVVDAVGASIGPFLTAAPPAPARVTIAGGTYIGDGVTPVAVQGGPNGNLFSVVGPGVNASTTQFTLMGKVSGCVVGNTAPTAVADPGAAAAAGQPQVINLAANDTPGAVGTVPINPGSIAITVPPANGTVAPNPDGTVTYTPNPTFSGTDNFTYTVQDNCGLTSNAMAVPVVVENLTVDRAEFRPRTGKWTISGQSSAPAGSTMTLHKGNTATGPAIGTATVKADGTYKFVGKSKTPPGPTTQPQSVTAQSAATVTKSQTMKVR